jgi:hypothetical protein
LEQCISGYGLWVGSLGIFGIDRKSCILPGGKTTKKRSCVFDSLRFQLDHRTGGRMFAWSRAIGNYQLVSRKFIDVIYDFRFGNQPGSPNVPGVVGRLVADINNDCLILRQQVF